MATRRVNDPNASESKGAPPTTPEAWERRLASKAMTLAEKQIDAGTASAQVISHYLKVGSSREFLEQERLAQEVELLKIKADTIKAQQRTEELYGQALEAMRTYSGQAYSEDHFDD